MSPRGARHERRMPRVTQDGARMAQEPIHSRLDEVGEGTRVTFGRARDQGVLAR
jgi:hypothetical protein